MASQQFIAQPEGYAQALLPFGGSPCGSSVSSDCAMEYSQCSASQQLQQQQQQQQQAQQLNRGDSDTFAGINDGWFSKCRGCGCMTAHEQSINGSDVPFCRRCQVTLDAACPRMRAKMVDTLLYVHQAWSNAGM